jgi:hypothetical protein
VAEFKYLGRMVTANDDDMKAVEHNIRRARMSWGNLKRILSKGKMKNPKAATSVYKTVVHAVLLYGSETWATTNAMVKKLENFHRRCARFITGQHIRKLPDDTWEYPSTEEIFRKTGLEPMTNYIEKRRMNVMTYLNNENQTMKDLRDSKDIEIVMKEVIWWNTNTENPIPNPNISLTP